MKTNTTSTTTTSPARGPEYWETKLKFTKGQEKTLRKAARRNGRAA